MTCSEVAFPQTAGAHYVIEYFLANVITVYLFAARQIANNLSPIDKKF